MDNIERLNTKKTVGLVTESFLSMPKRCQEMFFDYMETYTSTKQEAYLPFLLMGFDFEFCKSPIEIIFSMAFSVLSIGGNFEYNFILLEQESIQTEGGKYVVDFLFSTEENEDFYTFEHGLNLVIECDGHNFHNTTKRQVEYGNKRDHDLKLSGYDVLHFSGSQIYKEPWLCAKTVYDYIISKVGNIVEHLPGKAGALDA